MESWQAFLKNPYNGFDVFKCNMYLSDVNELTKQNDMIGVASAVEMLNLTAIRLVNNWILQNPKYEPSCDITMPFYNGISRAAILIMLGYDHGIHPGTIGLQNMLEEQIDVSTGTIVIRALTTNHNE
jgi:hypothetical protein